MRAADQWIGDLRVADRGDWSSMAEEDGRAVVILRPCPTPAEAEVVSPDPLEPAEEPPLG